MLKMLLITFEDISVFLSLFISLLGQASRCSIKFNFRSLELFTLRIDFYCFSKYPVNRSSEVLLQMFFSNAKKANGYRLFLSSEPCSQKIRSRSGSLNDRHETFSDRLEQAIFPLPRRATCLCLRWQIGVEFFNAAIKKTPLFLLIFFFNKKKSWKER